MLRSRVIPCLLVKNGGLVKTVRFSDPKYVGDPINAVKIFNEKEVDELIVLDIDATREGRSPDLRLIENLAAECRMPLCYGGGITNSNQAEQIISLGVEKVAISSAALKNPQLVGAIARVIGQQSVIVVMDVKRSMLGRYSVYIQNGTTNSNRDPVDVAQQMESLGAGEIVLNSIDNDGMMGGYDLNLAERIREAVDLPLTILGGAGSLDDLRKLVTHFRVIGAAAGSLFVFKGRYRAVLINYPNADEKQELVAMITDSVRP